MTTTGSPHHRGAADGKSRTGARHRGDATTDSGATDLARRRAGAPTDGDRGSRSTDLDRRSAGAGRLATVPAHAAPADAAPARAVPTPRRSARAAPADAVPTHAVPTPAGPTPRRPKPVVPAPRRPIDVRSSPGRTPPVGALDTPAEHTAPPATGTDTTSTPRQFRPDIEGLRALAVGSVVLAHAGLAPTGGYVGVDVFFVISGFLVTRQLTDELRRRGRISFAGFYARRLRRVAPAASLVLVATLLASWRWLPPLRIPAVAQDAVFAAASAANWRFVAQGSNPGHLSAPSPLEHYWSLSVGGQFDAVWPLLLIVAALPLGRRLGRQRTVVAVLLAVIAGSFALSVTLTATSPSWAYFGSPSRFWELATGALVAVAAGLWARIPRPLAAAVTWAGLGMIGYAAVVFTGGLPYPGSLAAVPVGGAALVIIGGCAAPRLGAALLLARAPMQWLGRRSYPLYLWHWPVLLLLPAALGRPSDDADAALVAVVAIGTSVTLAAATHHLVERPFSRWTALVRHPGRGIVVGGGLLAGAVAAALAVELLAVVPGAGKPPVPRPRAVVDATNATLRPAVLPPPTLLPPPTSVPRPGPPPPLRRRREHPVPVTSPEAVVDDHGTSSRPQAAPHPCVHGHEPLATRGTGSARPGA